MLHRSFDDIDYTVIAQIAVFHGFDELITNL